MISKKFKTKYGNVNLSVPESMLPGLNMQEFAEELALAHVEYQTAIAETSRARTSMSTCNCPGYCPCQPINFAF